MKLTDLTEITSKSDFLRMTGFVDDKGEPDFEWRGTDWDHWLAGLMPDDAERERLRMEFGAISVGNPSGSRWVLLNGSQSGASKFLQIVAAMFEELCFQLPADYVMSGLKLSPDEMIMYDFSFALNKQVHLFYFNDPPSNPSLDAFRFEHMLRRPNPPVTISGVTGSDTPLIYDSRATNFQFADPQDETIGGMTTEQWIKDNQSRRKVDGWLVEGIWNSTWPDTVS